MNKSILLVLVSALLAGFAGAQEESKVTWFADYDLAAAEAQKTKKDLFVDFTGSDWCGWCIRLDEEVFEHAGFLSAAQANYVLVKLDFPNSEAIKATVPNPARNDELMTQHEVQGFPTILLMSADGEVFGRTGYQEGGPDAYVKHMAELRKDGKAALLAAQALKKEFDAAEGDAIEAVVAKGIKLLLDAKPEAPGLKIIAEVARKGVSLDADNAKGMKAKALKGLLKAGLAAPEELAAARALDPKNEKGLLEYCVLADMQKINSEEMVIEVLPKLEAIIDLGIKVKENQEMILANTSFFHFRATKDMEKAKKYALLLKAIPDLSEDYDRLLEMVLADPEADHDHDHDGEDHDHDHDHEDDDQ